MRHADKILSFIEGLIAPLRKANWRVILLSILTATLFWFFNALNKDYTARINYPVEYEYNRDSLIAVNDLPDELPVNVTGGGWQLFKKTISLNVHPVQVKLDNPAQTSYLTGSSLLPIFSEQLNGLNVNYVAIDTVYLQIDKIFKRILQVKVDSSAINLKENYAIVSNVIVQPDSIEFIGPSGMVKKFSDPFIIKLTEKNIDSNYDEELSMDLFTSSLIKKNPEIIHVMFNVDEYLEQTSTIKIETVNFPYDSSIYLNEDEVTASYRIERGKRKNLNQFDLMVIADRNNINAEDSTITLEVINTPRYIKDLTLEQQKVKVIYGKKSH